MTKPTPPLKSVVTPTHTAPPLGQDIRNYMRMNDLDLNNPDDVIQALDLSLGWTAHYRSEKRKLKEKLAWERAHHVRVCASMQAAQKKSVKATAVKTGKKIQKLKRQLEMAHSSNAERFHVFDSDGSYDPLYKVNKMFGWGKHERNGPIGGDCSESSGSDEFAEEKSPEIAISVGLTMTSARMAAMTLI